MQHQDNNCLWFAFGATVGICIGYVLGRYSVAHDTPTDIQDSDDDDDDESLLLLLERLDATIKLVIPSR